jgi:quercetin dioxygenase-like cupin family protein
MKTRSHYFKFMQALTIATLLGSMIQESRADEPGKIAELLTQSLPDIPDREVTMITVTYPPGGSNPVHRHNADTFVYVLEGSITMQVKGGKEVTLNPGETFYENPTDIHIVGRNASDTKPAKFLVFFVKKKGAPLLIPVNK